MNATKGYVYFGIKTENPNLDLSDFDALLSIKPTRFQKMFEKGPIPKSTSWQFSSDNLISPFFFDEIEKLITKLEPHKDEFKELKLKLPELYFFLEVVIYMGDETPGLSFSRNTLEFINYLEAEIDCDIYGQ
jgi:hypothetical protein